MSTRNRLHREKPERSEPIRGFANFYQQAASPNGRQRHENQASQDNHGAPRGRLAHGVELAYQIIDKHIEEGRRTAQQFSKGPYSVGITTDSVQALLERMVSFQSEMLPLWVNALSTLVRADPIGAAYPPPSEAIPRGTSTRNHGAHGVSIEIESTNPVQVSLQLQDNTPNQQLAAQGLRSLDPTSPALMDISFTQQKAGGRNSVQIRIPETQPAGTYSGAIVDRNTGDARGTLTVRVGTLNHNGARVKKS
jgi:hypothetical protein